MAFLSKKRPGLKRMLIMVVIGLSLGYLALIAFVRPPAQNALLPDKADRADTSCNRSFV